MYGIRDIDTGRTGATEQARSRMYGIRDMGTGRTGDTGQIAPGCMGYGIWARVERQIQDKQLQDVRDTQGVRQNDGTDHMG